MYIKTGETELEVESEELDQSTKRYNFWTHQIHIFFIEKFIRPVSNLLNLRQIVDKMVKEELKRIKRMEKQKAATERWYQLCREAAEEASLSQEAEQGDNQNSEHIHTSDDFVEM